MFKFLVVGGGATLVDFLAMSLTLYLFAPDKYPNFFNVFYGSDRPTVAATVTGTAVGFTIGLIFNYVFSLIFVFTSSDTTRAKTVRGFVEFAALSSVGLIIHTAGMYLFFELLHADEWVIKIMLTAVVLVFNYVTRKYLLFNKKKKQ